MSDTVKTAVGSGAGEVHGYVEQVRAALDDLPAEDVDDLTIGMEADLGELMAESGADLRTRLGDPDGYAVELRAAAGLPPRSLAPAAAEPWWGVRAWRRARDARTAAVSRWPALLDLVPVWWVVRGVVAGWAVDILLGWPAYRWVVVVLAAVGSFWLGRRTAGLRMTPRVLIGAGNALALILLVPALGSLLAPGVTYVAQPYPVQQPLSSLEVNGESATSLYPYDAEGNRLDGVRLFNQYGQAVTVDRNALSPVDTPDGVPMDPATSEPQVNRQVFPLRWGTHTGWETSTGQWAPPVKITPLTPSERSGTATPSPTTGASATPSP